MFGMYAEKARRALELAVEDSRDPDRGSGGWLLPEHLVLALLSMPEDAVGSLQLALDLGCGCVGTEHLLLGVLYEGRYGPGSRPSALVEFGAT